MTTETELKNRISARVDQVIAEAKDIASHWDQPFEETPVEFRVNVVFELKGTTPFGVSTTVKANGRDGQA